MCEFEVIAEIFEEKEEVVEAQMPKKNSNGSGMFVEVALLKVVAKHCGPCILA